MRFGLPLTAVCLVALISSTAQAERPPQFRKDADLVVAGTVEKITTNDRAFGSDGVMTTYTVEIAVDSVDKGEKVKGGDTVKATWFYVTKRPSRPFPGAYGQNHNLKKGDKARFWLLASDSGVYSVIYNRDGVEKLKK